MASQKQLEANRRNCLKSTGPRTPEGKAIVALNALKHGLRSERAVAPGEDPEEFANFREELLSELAGGSAVESIFVERLVLAAWRLRRVVRMEVEMMMADCEVWDGDELSKHTTLGRKVGPVLGGSEKYCRLWAYELQLDGMLRRALHELERLRAVRKACGAAPPPLAVDVDISGVARVP